jgi:hypothetical protein
MQPAVPKFSTVNNKFQVDFPGGVRLPELPLNDY